MKYYSPNKNLKVLIKREEYGNFGGIMSLVSSPVFVQFSDRFFETQDEETIELLKKSREYSEVADAAKSFWPWIDVAAEAKKKEDYVRALEEEVMKLREAKAPVEAELADTKKVKQEKAKTE